LRELQGIIDNTNQAWAVDMQSLLREMKKTVDEFKADSQTALPTDAIEAFDKEYDRILKLGEVESPRDGTSRKQSKSRNLLDRFVQYRTEICRFADNFAVPFDNNQAERDIRNAKVKMKVSCTELRSVMFPV
jgi:transposase